MGDCRSIGSFTHHNGEDDEEANHERRPNVGRVLGSVGKGGRSFSYLRPAFDRTASWLS